MKPTIAKSPTFKWMVLPILLATLPLIMSGFNTILHIYPQDWNNSFITVEGSVLIVGILSSLFLIKKLTSPIKRLSKAQFNNLATFLSFPAYLFQEMNSR